MGNLRFLVQHYLRAAWRRRWIGVIVAWLVCGLGWVGVYLIPNQFESSARLLVDTDALLSPPLRGIAADSAPASQLEILRRTLLSRPNMAKLISGTALDRGVKAPADREQLITRLAGTIQVTQQTTNLFTVAYRDKSPKTAHDVMQALLTIFSENAAGSNQSDMDNARQQLERQVASYEQQLRAAEQRRADFRARYIDILPNVTTPGVPALDAARNTVSALDGKLQNLVMARDALKAELDKTPPMLAADAPPPQLAPVSVPAAKTPLQDAEDQLRVLLLRDTEKHPDVIAQRKLIAELKAAAPDAPKVPAQAAGRAGDARPATTRPVPNPVYDQLKVRLIDADSQVTALQGQRDAAVAYQAKLQKIQQEQPGLLAEYENTDRDYQVLRKSYEDLLMRLQVANIAQAAGTQTDQVKLQIVDPPEVPRLPAAPNRLLLVTGVLLAGCAAGLGVSMLFGHFDSSFSTADDLRSLGLPVLGGISVLGLASLRQRLTIVARFGVAVVLLAGIYGGLVVHILGSLALI